MNIRQSFYTAARNLYVNKLRFVQVMSSLVIAVAAVIVICNTCRLMVQQVETSWTPDILSNIDVYIDTRVELDKRPTIENLDEIVKLPVVYRHYKKFKWLKNLTNGGTQNE